MKQRHDDDRVDGRDETTSGNDYLELKRMLRALGDVVRLMVISVLDSSAETTVTDLAELLAARGKFVSQPLISWHISQLRRAGFVHTRRAGRQVYCSLDKSRYRHCLRMLGELTGEPHASDMQKISPVPSAISHAAERNEIQAR